MSTKIYSAYRLKRGKDLWSFVRHTQKEALNNIKKELIQVTTNLLVSRRNMFALDTWFEVYREISTRYREASHSPEKSYWNFDVSLTIRERNGRFYIIPYCDGAFKDVLNFLNTDEWVEPFHYWNNVDTVRMKKV